MTFSSVEFIIFFSVVFICYWLACRTKALQNGLLVLASCVFYGWWDWRFLGLLGVTALSTYASGQLMRKYDVDKGKRKAALIATIVLNLGILFYFKYFNFFIESFVDFVGLFGINLTTSTLKILLPVGISFYTFSALSYAIDVYQRKVEATDDLLAYSAYVMFFPSILSGPISRAQKQLPQYMQKRSFDYDAAIAACKAILMGGGNEAMSCRPTGHLCRCSLW